MNDTRKWYVSDYYDILGYAQQEHGGEHIFTSINAATTSQIVEDHNKLHAPDGIANVPFAQLVRRCQEQRDELRTLAEKNAALTVSLLKATRKNFHMRTRVSALLSNLDTLTAATWDCTSPSHEPDPEPAEAGCE